MNRIGCGGGNLFPPCRAAIRRTLASENALRRRVPFRALAPQLIAPLFAGVAAVSIPAPVCNPRKIQKSQPLRAGTFWNIWLPVAESRRIKLFASVKDFRIPDEFFEMNPLTDRERFIEMLWDEYRNGGSDS